MRKRKDIINEGSYWFKRFQKDIKKMSENICFVRIKYGYYRIYWMGSGENAYLGECTKNMPFKGYDLIDKDIYLESQKHYEQYEDQIEYIQKLKNFVEGYVDLMDSIMTRVYMMKHNKEFYKTAVNGYRQMRVI